MAKMNIFQRLRVTKVSRLKRYLAELEKEIPVKDQADQERLGVLNRQMNSSLLKMRLLTGVRVFFFILLYASVISNFISDVSIFAFFTKRIVLLSSVIGTTVSLFFLWLLTRFINIYWEDVRTFSTHIIAAYARNEKGKTGKLDHFIEMLQDF
ncbi:MAG: hypothetical protein V1743_05490 [Nanoarchaeota archaeon]